MKKPMISLLIAAYNEEKVIAATLRSAIAAGLAPKDIYVVDDHSADKTAKEARALLPRKNVLRVERSGKGLAIAKAAEKFKLTQKYRWVHLADADCAFAPGYFKIMRRELRVEHAAATGYIRSMRGSIIGQYRVMDYTVGMEIVRRFQAIAGVVAIIPGPSSCFRADVFDKLNFRNGALAEDFDVTLQIHRQKLGTIQFIEEAQVFTQDPDTLRNFVRQIHRWYKGVLQGMAMHKIGLRASKIDTYLMYQLGLNLAMFINYGIFLPILALERGIMEVYSAAFLLDILLNGIIVAIVAKRAKRWDILNAFPCIYALHWLSLAVFAISFVEVIILGRNRKPKDGTWEVMKRQAPLEHV